MGQGAASVTVPEPRRDAQRSDGGPPGGRTNGPAPRPQRRPISARSPLAGRQLWRIGDWGSASEHIGRRWESVGIAALRRLVGVERPGPDGEPYTTRKALVLGEEPELAAAVQANGKSHADALLIGEQNGRTVLEPVDFKWTLETANPKQVSVAVLGELLTDPPAPLAARLRELMADLPAGDPVYLNGMFLAPEHADNRAQLAPRGPLDPTWAELSPVDATAFFSPLPGWDVAGALAQMDRARLGTIEAADKYYRLGAGILGAMRRLEAGIFADAPADLDGPASLAAVRRQRRLNTSGEVVAYFDRALTARGEFVDKLRDVERAGYPFGRFRLDIAERGLQATGPTDRRWTRLYGSIMKVVGQHVRAEGRLLAARGQTELQALAALENESTRWLALGRAELAARLATPAPDERPT